MTGEEPRIGVYVCECGINIGAVIDVPEVVRFAQGLPNVVIARQNRYTCSEAGQEMIKVDIREQHLTRVVVASCSPRMHEITFQNACEAAGLNRYYFQMANIREQDSWVVKDHAQATAKAKRLINAAVARVSHHMPLQQRKEAVTQAALVVGAGIAGIQAALTIAEAGYQVYLVEKKPSIGGRMAQLDKTFPTLDCST
jgi:heterodisulfide reductase subunit A2